MAEFLMPSLGADMESGKLVSWLVKPGQAVQRGDLVCVVETQKGAIDVEIFEGGTIVELLVQPGTDVPVGTPLALLQREGETLAAVRAARPAAAPAPAAPAAAPAAPAAEPPRSAPSHEGRGPRASPAARNAARELGVDLAALTGTGLGGAITLQDVEHAAASRAPARPAPPAPAAAAAPPAERAPSAMRQAIAAAMSRSKREIPHYYLRLQSDMGRALEWLRAENDRRTVADRVLPAALLLKAVAIACKRYPDMNGFFRDATFHPAPDVHLGVAISLKDGLVAPALHSVADKPLPEVMSELSDLIQRARRGGLRSSELSDSTITVTSLGDNGVDEVFGIIFPPQVALVGIGRIVERPSIREGQIVARPTVQLSLAADHRVSDGIRGALFLNAIDRLLQEPEGL